jgi:hypothetical protein
MAAIKLCAKVMLASALVAVPAILLAPAGLALTDDNVVDCTPSPANNPLPAPCTTPLEDQSSSFDISNLPTFTVTPGAAKSRTTFNFSAIVSALGAYAAAPFFYVTYGDGTGFGSPTDLRAINSFPTSHTYSKSGEYTLTGYGVYGGQVEQASVTFTVDKAIETEPTTAPLQSAIWEPVATPPSTNNASTQVESPSQVNVTKTVLKAAPSPTIANAPKIAAAAGTATAIRVGALPDRASVLAAIRIGGKWTTLPDLTTRANGTTTLAPLTFTKPGSYPVRLTLPDGSLRYLKVISRKE